MAEIGIFVGTMYGNSLLVAEEAEAGGQAEADGSTTILFTGDVLFAN